MHRILNLFLIIMGILLICPDVSAHEKIVCKVTTSYGGREASGEQSADSADEAAAGAVRSGCGKLCALREQRNGLSVDECLEQCRITGRFFDIRCTDLQKKKVDVDGTRVRQLLGRMKIGETDRMPLLRYETTRRPLLVITNWYGSGEEGAGVKKNDGKRQKVRSEEFEYLKFKRRNVPGIMSRPIRKPLLKLK